MKSNCSIIIPTFNRFKYLLNTIESVKKQTYTNLEIIVIPFITDSSRTDRGGHYLR